jgi:hypothetical protein
VRSARSTSAGALAALPMAVLLTGCVTTQRIATRARLVNSRILASQTPIRVVAANPEVSVIRTTLIRTSTGSAIAVSLVNDSARALTDLPISVGTATRAGPRVYLNQSATLDYFQSHVAAIGPHANVTWVFATGRRVAAGARPFATVGDATLSATVPGRLPQIAATVRRTVSGTGALGLEVAIVNRSVVPQYDVPVYAIAVRDGRDVAAGSVSVVHLGTHGRTTVRLTVIGSTSQAALELAALPTIFS